MDEFKVGYYCTCSKEKIESIIAGMPESEILSLPDETGVVKAGCQFCNKEYTFTVEDLKKLIDKKEK